MRIPKNVRDWMKNHTVEDLEEYLFDERLADLSQEILFILSEMNELDAIVYNTEEIQVE